MAVELQRGIKILQEFPTLQTCNILLESHPIILDIWQSPMMIRTCLAQVWLDYGRQLNQPRKASGLAKIITNLCMNGKNPVSMDPTADWKNWFGGSCIRWEMLSILFSFFGRAFKRLDEWDSIFSLPEQRGMKWVLAQNLERTNPTDKMTVRRLRQRKWRNAPWCV